MKKTTKTPSRKPSRPSKAAKAEKPARAARKPRVAKPAKATKASAKRVTFTFRADVGKTVCLAGSFNGWDPAAKKMKDAKKNGVYATTVKLAPGTYEYKFVVDGAWLADPECADFVQNGCGTLNSVLTVK